MFKVFICVVFISQKAYFNKKHRSTIDGLLKEIATLEAQHKATEAKKVSQEFDIKLGKLHLLEASLVEKSILYARKYLFEQGDKPNKQLDTVLAQGKSMQSFPETMVMTDGEVQSIPDKLKTFVEYYKNLYESSHPSVDDCMHFLETINLPTLTIDQQLHLNADIWQEIGGSITTYEVR